MLIARPSTLGSVCMGILALAGCSFMPGGEPPILRPATGASLRACADLPGRFSFPSTSITSAALVPAGTLQLAGAPVAEHCLVTGRMHERVSPVDGQTYAIGFQMRMPVAWNGRFFYQGNGGIDGSVSPALGAVSGGGDLSHALSQGFAVISSDAGHAANQNPLFGLDPQARLDYGYQAVGKLTPMAKNLILAAYAKPPDRSYIGGCSNGGRHVMVAAARYPDQFDGFLAGDPGFNLPQSAIAQLFGAQQYAKVATTNDLASAFTPAERRLVAAQVLRRCDGLDGVVDGMVNATSACQAAFDIVRDVPSCSAERDGTCLSVRQKEAIGSIFDGFQNSSGQKLYASFPYDAGISGADWASWEFVASVTNRDPVATAFIFQTPPAPSGAVSDPRAFALNFNMDTDAAKIFATSGLFQESSMSFMTPPEPTQLNALKRRGAKLIVFHGTSDAVFSAADTAAWYDGLRAANGGDAADFARYFAVPGMNHCRGGPSTDQFDMLTALVNWVEKGQAPDAVLAAARGAGNRGGVNPEVPAGWSATRTRPLCPYPKIATYVGTGDVESAESFRCQ